MTVADEIVATLSKMIGGPFCSRDDALRYTHTAIREAVRAAIAAEREACAKIADDHEKAAIDQCWLTAKSIASVIRARGKSHD